MFIYGFLPLTFLVPLDTRSKIFLLLSLIFAVVVIVMGYMYLQILEAELFHFMQLLLITIVGCDQNDVNCRLSFEIITWMMHVINMKLFHFRLHTGNS